MPKRRSRKPAPMPRPSAAASTVGGPQGRANPDLAFARPIQVGGAWFPAVWPM